MKFKEVEDQRVVMALLSSVKHPMVSKLFETRYYIKDLNKIREIAEATYRYTKLICINDDKIFKSGLVIKLVTTDICKRGEQIKCVNDSNIDEIISFLCTKI